MSVHARTPGPWQLTRNGKNGDTYRIWRDGKGPKNEGYHCIAPHVMGIGNADLIAAAPDLLAACEVAIDLTDKWKRTEHGADFHEVDRVLRQAIARAKGGA